MLQFLLALLLTLTTALANVEKTIFLAPTPSPFSSSSNITPDLSDLGLDLLSPENTIFRTKLNASFPSPANPEGTESWFLLEGLNPGQRYEVRVCWLATQPTSFTLSTYPLDAIIDDPSLLASISHFSSARVASVDGNNPKEIVPQVPNSHHAPSRPLRRTQSRDSDSVLFLRIHAAADYFTNEQRLMENVPPVIADVILDPFLGNVFPKSLVPTACWGLLVGVAAIGIARWVVKEFGRVILHGIGSKSAAGSTEKKGQ
ncbi:hypothetical protein SI65_09222 [Aspergillus cristatus]|uniref:Uncharacterized protein n=1 Tax=Aspergillus cristatus TaxID=573508 RepID=A0A1E3B385_ASPCR|nr:hypothetical protein SI65_09222 [Aspergillus cristatus]